MPEEVYGLGGGGGGGGGGTSGIDLTLAGNTAGVLALMSSGTVTLAGGSNITLSQAGNAVTILGAAGAGTPFGLSAGTQSVSTGTVSFANSNGITFGMSGSNQITASYTVPTQTAQTGISSIVASDATYTSGQVIFIGSNMVTVKSGAGQSVVVDATQSIQSQNLFDLTLGGNTAGALALVSSGTLTLAGGNNITLSQAGNAITISGPNAAGAQTGISSIVASDATYTSGQVIFIGSNMVTVKSGAGQSVVIDATQSIQTQNIAPIATNVKVVGSLGSTGTITRFAPEDHQHAGLQSINVGGNTAGATTSGAGSFLLAGGPNITLSGATIAGGMTLSISANATVSVPPIATAVKGVSSIGSTGTVTRFAPEDHQHAGVFSAGVSTGGNTIGNTGVIPGQFVFAAGNNITLSQITGVGNLVTISLSGPSLTSPVVSNGILDVSTATASGTGVTQFAAHDHQHRGLRAYDVQGVASTFFGNFQMSAGNLIALSTAGNTTAGTVAYHNLLSSATAISSVTSANVIGAMASRFALEAHQHAGVGPAGVSTFGNTAGSTGVLQGQLVMVGSNNITLSQSTDASNRMTVTWLGVTSASLVPADVIQSITSSNLSGTQNSFFARGDHQHAGVGPAGVSTFGNTAGSTAVLQGQIVFVGSNNITLSQSTNASNGMTISIQGGAGGAFTGGVSTGGNTSGTTGTVGSQIIFVGSNQITLSQSTNGASATITISGPTGGGAGISTGGNTLGTSGTVGAQLVFVGGNNITLSGSTAATGSGTITISCGSVVSWVEMNEPPAVSVAGLTAASFSHRPIFVTFFQPGASLLAKTIRLYLSRGTGTTLNCTMGVGIYSISNSTKLNLISSTTHAYSLTASSDWSGVRVFDFTGLSNVTLSQGPYILGFHLSASNTSTAVGNLLLIGGDSFLSPVGSVLTGTNSSGATNATNFLVPWLGVLASTSAALPSTVGTVDFIGGAGTAQLAAYYAIIKQQ